MQRARSNVGRASVPMSGRNATKLGSTPQPQPASYKPNEYGHADVSPRTIDVPAPSAARPQAAAPNVPRSGSREIARVDSAGLVEAGRQTTGGQQVQQVAPVLNNTGSV